MKALIRNFSIPKEGKISDKTLTYNIVAGILGILLCLTSLTAATWAWFGSSLTSDKNTIKSGQYFVEKTVEKKISDDEVTVQNETATEKISSNAEGVYTLTPNTAYHITLVGQGDVTTGYCTVTLTGSSATVHTQQIFTEIYADPDNGKVPTISFDLLIENVSNDVQLTIEPCWGTSSKSDDEKLLDGGTYTYDGERLTDATLPDVEQNNTTENNESTASEAN